MSLKCFDQLIGKLRECLAGLPDKRTGSNIQYSMETIGLSAISVFFTQSPSFLSHQKSMEIDTGQSNAQTLFGIDKVPTANHIRDMLDPVEPEKIHTVYDAVYQALKEQGILDSFRGVKNTRFIALDGTWYFSSQSDHIHCPNCSCNEHANGEVTHYHSAVTPVIVGSGQPYAIPLRPEFVVPQDGSAKQDCEINAAKRWLEKNGAFYNTGNDTLLGDDLYSRQPFCRRALLHNFHFIFVCKPESHKPLYEWVDLLEPRKDLHIVKMRVRNEAKKCWEEHTYRYANKVPLTGEQDALEVNWCEVTITVKDEQVYRNSFVTDFTITADNVAGIAAGGRVRWKIENENNNVLKNRGYHLEHNFGHGKQHLASLLVSLNILAFLFHAFLSFCDEAYQLIRATLPTRQTFFEHIRALTCYICFPSWQALMDFMLQGLEIGPYAKEKVKEKVKAKAKN